MAKRPSRSRIVARNRCDPIGSVETVAATSSYVNARYPCMPTAASPASAAARNPGAPPRGSLELSEVDTLLDHLAHTAGKGSSAAKARLLWGLFARATSEEQEFLFRLLIGELRQGALEGVVTEAVARA